MHKITQTLSFIALLLFVAACNLKTGSVKEDAESPKKTSAEIWIKSGGQFQDSKYIGGEFESVQSLRVPDECTDHSEYIKYEGPGWESNKIGYRLYLDHRNAIDIFGKKTQEMVLKSVGQDGYESYHGMADWGMDILKVGGSLGIGSIAFWNGERAIRVEKTDSIYCEIVADNALQSEIRIDYSGWEIDSSFVDLHTSLSISADSRSTKYSIKLSDKLENLCTGIVKSDNAELIDGQKPDGWSYLATWGKQSLAEDNLGMAVFYQSDKLIMLTEDAESHVLVLEPREGYLEYYFMAAWEQEPGGIKIQDDFINELEQKIQVLNDMPRQDGVK